MFNKLQLKYLIDSKKVINYNLFSKSDLLTFIDLLEQKVKDLENQLRSDKIE